MFKRTALILLVLASFLASGCGDPNAQWKRERREAWEEPCHEVSWLLATTSGSPDRAECPNQRHKMRVQTVTVGANEEIGSLVFCECK